MMNRKGHVKSKGWDSLCSVCAASVSVICMTSMTAAAVATGAAAAAGATGMAGMGGMNGAESPQANPSVLSALANGLERLGLGFLNRIPNGILQPLLILLLSVSMGAAWVAYRGHRRPQALILTLMSTVLMYLSIYLWMSEVVYFLSLVGLIGAGLLGMYLARHPANVQLDSTMDR